MTMRCVASHYFYYVDVSYHRFTDDDLTEAQEEKQHENDEIDNDM